jgi:hypothetical protein
MKLGPSTEGVQLGRSTPAIEKNALVLVKGDPLQVWMSERARGHAQRVSFP